MRTNISVCCLLIHPGHSPDVPAVCGSSGRQCATACVCVCTCMHSTRRVHAYMHSCMYTSIDVCVCVCVLICVCNWGVGGLVVVLVGGVWSFFKHSCVVMVA